MCFKYAATVALNHETNTQGIENIEPYTDTYNWKNINFPTGK